MIAISDPYHMCRVQWAFEQVYGNRVRLHYGSVPFNQNAWSQMEWWRSPASRSFVLEEYLKLARYMWLYG